MQMEIVALRHQLAVYQRTAKRARIQPADRILWAWLSRHWSRWRNGVGLRPARDGHCMATPEVPGTLDETESLREIGAAHCFPRCSRSDPANVQGESALGSDRRRVIHFNVTANPAAAWTAPQIVEAFPWQDPPKYLRRDRDKIYGKAFQKRVTAVGFEEVLTAARSPWQNPYVERLIGMIRRDCLDHVIVVNERHLSRILADYFTYNHSWRAHLSRTEAIAAAARELDDLRSRWLNPPEWVREEILGFPGSMTGPWSRYVHDPDARGIGTVRYPRLVPHDPDCAAKLGKRTLTNLYNERPTWLALAHEKLDAAVFAAYGWEPSLTDEQILEEPLALNLERAGGGQGRA